MRQRDEPAELAGRGIERYREQDAGKNQEERCRKKPGESQERRKEHCADAADRNRPGQIVTRLKTFLI